MKYRILFVVFSLGIASSGHAFNLDFSNAVRAVDKLSDAIQKRTKQIAKEIDGSKEAKAIQEALQTVINTVADTATEATKKLDGSL